MIKPGDIVPRVFGEHLMTVEMRVSDVTADYICCDAMRKDPTDPWVELPPDAEPWRFDTAYGVETDHEQKWGIAYKLVLSYLDLPDELPWRVVTEDGVHRFLRNTEVAYEAESTGQTRGLPVRHPDDREGREVV